MKLPPRKRNPIILISGPQFRVEDFEPYASNLELRFTQILSGLRIVAADGRPCEIEVHVEAATPHRVDASARRTSADAFSYEIRLSAGLLHHVWMASRTIMVDWPFFDWIDQVKVNAPELKGQPRKEALANLIFYLLGELIFFHELSHIALGHFECVAHHARRDTDRIVWTEQKQVTSISTVLAKALEADADRQAGLWAFAAYDDAVGPGRSKRGMVLPSRRALYEFYVFAITVLFALYQQLSFGKRNKSHPTPVQRHFITIASLFDYIDKFEPANREFLTKAIGLRMVKSIGNLGLGFENGALKSVAAGDYMAGVGESIERFEVRGFMHQVDPA